VESLLERVLRRLDTLGDTGEPPELQPTGIADSNPSFSTVVTPANDSAPVLSLFDNGVVWITYGILHRSLMLTTQIVGLSTIGRLSAEHHPI
jgi:hypothetical protein